MTSNSGETGFKRDTSPGEAATSDSLEYLRQMSFLYMQDGFSIVDAAGVHIDINPAFCAMTGFAADELLGRYPSECYWPPEEYERIASAFAETLGGEFCDIQLIFMRKNGERFPVIVNPFPIRDASGSVVYFAATVKEITQRVKLESELRNTEDRFRALFEHAGDAIMIMEDWQIIDCNERTLQMFSLTREQLLAIPTFEFFSPRQPNGRDSREFFREKVEASSSGAPQLFEWSGENLDRLQICIEVSLNTVESGNRSYMQITVRDITRRKEMERALIELNTTLESRIQQRTDELEAACTELTQRNAQFRALAAQLTEAENDERRRIVQLLHDEHQQLLVAAKFRAEMLQIDSMEPDVRAIGQQVVEILDQALDASRTLTMELAPPILYGSGLVDALQWLARWMNEHHGLDVTVKGTLPMVAIPTDISTLVFQAAREMLLNVVKHSGVGAAGVTVALFHQQLVVTITDDGEGFDVAAALASTRSIGLFSIQQRLEKLEGNLDIRSEQSRGTEVTLTIPLANSGMQFRV